jgi:Flp pilus assembly pilin Flp
MAEYGVVLTVISLAVIGVFAAFSQGVQNAIARAVEALASGF